MDLAEVCWGHLDWIGLAQDRDKWIALVTAVMNLRVPYYAGKLSSGFTMVASRVVFRGVGCILLRYNIK
jgi:hypothetical protein